MRFNRLRQDFKFISALFAAKLARRRVPLIAILGVTNRCNLKCWYCYGEHPYRYNCREFTTQELLEIVSQLHQLGTRILQLQGGEPLLRDDLEAVITRAHRLGITCDMVTNGTLIPQKKEIIRLLDKICISLDGPAMVNDQNRGEGSYLKIVEGIKLARSYGLAVRISSVLTAQTKEEDIDWLVNFCRQNNLTLNFSPSFDFTANFTPGKFQPHVIPEDKLRKLFRYIKQHKIKNAPIQFSAASYDIAGHWPFIYEKRMATQAEFPAGVHHPKCYHADYAVFIDSDGSVYPCCNFWGRPRWNIRKDGLTESIRGLSRQGCRACYTPAYIDRNLFFSGAAGVWGNYITQNLKELIWTKRVGIN
ncbi:MAG: radical SAM protein [Candidatus Omnitrophica bacterium]|nr:radical SAM protein [Candidatus Omnitrophota bacterium]